MPYLSYPSLDTTLWYRHHDLIGLYKSIYHVDIHDPHQIKDALDTIHGLKQVYPVSEIKRFDDHGVYMAVSVSEWTSLCDELCRHLEERKEEEYVYTINELLLLVSGQGVYDRYRFEQQFACTWNE
ncbi:hypothetical protein BDB01DRAFT_850083 [Pilobolus umbonatus]|nr:hypothetical protein BDB01DRAFT_850083 [Pilobolus umbonatus]